MKITTHKHAHLWLAIVVAYCTMILVIVMLILYVDDKSKFEIFTLDGYLGAIGTFIAICTAVMLGAQIYSIYNRTQSEKEYDQKLDEITEWFLESSENIKAELHNVSKAAKNLSILKYHINEAMGGLHYSEGKKLEGVIDVMENIYTFTCNETLFIDYFGGYREKLDVSCYYIAKNLKEYASDRMVRNFEVERLVRFKERWNKRFYQLDRGKESVQFVNDRLAILNNIINKLVDGLLCQHGKYRMDAGDYNKLCDMAKD